MGVPIRVSAEYDMLVKDQTSKIGRENSGLKLHHGVRLLVFALTGSNASRITQFLMANIIKINGKTMH